MPDIYDGSMAPRDVYALAAQVRPGNSGGPLLSTTGEVAGLVFARAEGDDDLGYAMTPAELTPVVDRLAADGCRGGLRHVPRLSSAAQRIPQECPVSRPRPICWPRN